MKIKHIVGALVAVLGCALMSVSAHAATELTVGEVTSLADGRVRVPVTLNSTDYDNCASYTVRLKYDKSKYTWASVGNLVKVDGYDDNGDPAKVNYGTIYANPDYYNDGCLLTWSVEEYKFENGTCPLFNAFLTPVSGVTASKDDFSITVDELVYIKDGKTTIIEDKLATYITYDVPMTVGDDWTYGYIHGLKAVVKEKGTETVLASKDLTLYTEQNGNYRFVIKFTSSSGKQIVDVDIVASTAKTEDATADFEEVVVNSVSGLAVEALN